MILKIKKRPLEPVDVRKRSKLQKRLLMLSKRKRLEALKDERKRPLKRSENSTPPTASPTSKTTVQLNISGNLRGMHNRTNPPDSEHMRKIRAMRRMYNKQMPQLQCNGCAFATSCPQFKANYECAFLPFLNAHRIEDEADLLFYMKEVAGANMRRAHQATLMETLTGGAPSLEVSEALNLAFMQLKSCHEAMIESAAQGTVTVTTDDKSIINKLFGNLETLMHTTESARDNPIEVDRLELANKVDSPLCLEDKQGDDVHLDLATEHTKEELKEVAVPASSVEVTELDKE